MELSDSDSQYHSDTDALREDASDTSDGASPLKETERALRNVARALFIPMTEGREDAPTRDAIDGKGTGALIKSSASSYSRSPSPPLLLAPGAASASPPASAAPDAEASYSTSPATVPGGESLPYSPDRGDGEVSYREDAGGPKRPFWGVLRAVLRTLRPKNDKNALERQLEKERKKLKNAYLTFVLKIKAYTETDESREKNMFTDRSLLYGDVKVNEVKNCEPVCTLLMGNGCAKPQSFDVIEYINEWATSVQHQGILKVLGNLNAEKDKKAFEAGTRLNVTWPDVYKDKIEEIHPKLFRDRTYVKHFGEILGPSDDIDSVFAEARPLVDDCAANGNHAVFISYGQNKTDKTLTLHGSADAEGLTLKIVQHLFDDYDGALKCKFVEFIIGVEEKNGSARYIDCYRYLTASGAAFQYMPDITSASHPLRTWDVNAGNSKFFKTLNTTDAFTAEYNAAKLKMADKPKSNSFRSHFVTVLSPEVSGGTINVVDLLGKAALNERFNAEVGKDESLKNVFKSDVTLGKINANDRKALKENSNIKAILHEYDAKTKEIELIEQLFNEIGRVSSNLDLKKNTLRFKGRLGDTVYGGRQGLDNRRFVQTLDWMLRSSETRTTRALVFMCLDSYDLKGASETLGLLPCKQNAKYNLNFELLETTSESMTERQLLIELTNRQLQGVTVENGPSCFFDSLRMSMKSLERSPDESTHDRKHVVDEVKKALKDENFKAKMSERLKAVDSKITEVMPYLNARACRDGNSYQNMLERMLKDSEWAGTELFEVFFLLLNRPVILYTKQDSTDDDTGQMWIRHAKRNIVTNDPKRVLHMLHSKDERFNALAWQNSELTDEQKAFNAQFLSGM